MTKGQPDVNLYVVTSGRIRVFSDNDVTKKEDVITEVSAGGSVMSLFSVLSILTGQAPVPLKVTAVAAVDSNLIRLPLEAFSKLVDKYPNAVHNVVHVIMTRFQRVTFLTLNRYFGLTSELLNVEANINRPLKVPKVRWKGGSVFTYDVCGL